MRALPVCGCGRMPVDTMALTMTDMARPACALLRTKSRLRSRSVDSSPRISVLGPLASDIQPAVSLPPCAPS